MAIPSGLACDSFSDIPLIGCCPPIPSTVWGIGAIAIVFPTGPGNQNEEALSYGRVSTMFETLRDIVNNWPEPMEEATEPNTVTFWSWESVFGGPFERTSLTNPFGVCGIFAPPNNIRPFDNYFPFSAIKHEPQIIDNINFDPTVQYYYASAMRVKVSISSDIPQIRRKTVFGTSFGGACDSPGHRYPNRPEFENFVVEEDVILNNPLSIELLVPPGEIPVHPDPLEPGGFRPIGELSRVRATILSLP